MLQFKKYKRKPTYVDMAKVSSRELKELLNSTIDGKTISISDEDIKYANDSDDIAGYIATDGDSYWFINIDFAKKNYELD